MAKALTTVLKLLNRINAIDTGDINKLLFQSLSSATTQLRSLIQTKSFDATVGLSEDFFIDPNNKPITSRFLKFRLSNGFVDETTNSLSLKYGLTEADLSTAVDIDTNFFSLDLEKGLVIFDTFEFVENSLSFRTINNSVNFSHYIFRITYDHGFTDSNTKEGKVYKGVPDWLEEIALIKGREIYQLTNPKKDKSPKENAMNLSILLDEHIRYNPTYLRPII